MAPGSENLVCRSTGSWITSSSSLRMIEFAAIFVLNHLGQKYYHYASPRPITTATLQHLHFSVCIIIIRLLENLNGCPFNIVNFIIVKLHYCEKHVRW